MKSFYNNTSIKEKYLARIRIHAAADEIIKGIYWKDGKGCAIGCLFHSSDHAAMVREWDCPEWLARLCDIIFEGLPNNEAKIWPERFTSSIPVGIDLEKVKWQFCVFILRENIDRVLSFKDISDELKKKVVDSIHGVLKIYEKTIKTNIWDDSAARSAESVARSVAESAGSEVGSTAGSAAWAAVGSAERSVAYERYADKLIELLLEAR